MKVLLFGDCSKVHHTLSQGLRELGVDSFVASHGDGWKNYERDIDITMKTKWQTIDLFLKFLYSSKFRGYDVVQFINYAPALTTKKWSNVLKMMVYIFKKNNKKLFLGAFGDDYYWVKACRNGSFEYAFLEMFDQKKTEELDFHCRQTLIDNATPQAEQLNSYFARECNGIIAGLYDYWYPYSQTEFAEKLDFIPFPINVKEIAYKPNILHNNKISFLIGVQQGRHIWKGIDFLQPVLEEYKAKYPNDIDLHFVENCPYNEYLKILEKTNVVVDQIYSMGQGMNALTSMAMGKIVLSGGEDCHYDLIKEEKNKPVVNVKPDKQQIRMQMDYLLDRRSDFQEWGYFNRKFIEDHHNYINVAQQYLNVWNKR